MSKYLSIDSIVKKNDGSEYKILEILGIGANTVTYLTECKNNNGIINKRILKEYCPSYLNIERDEMNNISTENIDKFLKGKEMFIKGGANQNELRSKIELTNQTPPLLDIFETNNTVYLDVVPFVGKTLNKVNDLSFVELLKLSITITKLVKQYHKLGYLCLDIKPDNIYVLYNDDEVVTDMVEFIDFDSVRSKESIGFGTSLSFTTSWAAPEQLNIFSYAKISERTDVYTIGELVFYLIFGRHSTTEEHRMFFKFNFEEENKHSIYLKRPIIKKQLNYLFKNTLRSSAKNRFANVDEIVMCLNRILEQAEKKEILIPYPIHKKDFFVGREKEIKDIEQQLKTNNILFVSGSAGVGKSELVKKYIALHETEYDNILYFIYENDIVSMITSNKTVSISNFDKLTEETEQQYYERKLSKLAELTTANTLIYIDNFDILAENIEDKSVWKKLISLKGKYIITTRCFQTDFNNLIVEPIDSEEQLVNIYKKYCDFSFEEEQYVNKIISLLDNNTLLIELIAKQTSAAHISPIEMYERLSKEGLHSLRNDYVTLLKDEEVNSKSIMGHLMSILSITEISKFELEILLYLSLMPNNGIELNEFKKLFAIDDNNHINLLVNSGWISIKHENGELLYVHPIVSSIIPGFIALNDDAFIDYYFEKCMRVISHRNKEISYSNFGYYCKSIIDKIYFYKITNRNALRILLWFNSDYSQMNRIYNYNVVNFAIDNYEKYYVHNYSAILEKGYRQLLDYFVFVNDFEKAFALVNEHIEKTKKNKDKYSQALWLVCKGKLYNIRNKNLDFFKYDFTVFKSFLVLDKLEDDYCSKKPKIFNENNFKLLDYPLNIINISSLYNILIFTFINLIENLSITNLYYEKANWLKKYYLVCATNFRRLYKKRYEDSHSNSVKLDIDIAVKHYYKGEYNEVYSLMCETLKKFEAEASVSYYSKIAVADFAAHVCYLMGDYNNSYVYYNKAREFIEKTESSYYDLNTDYGLLLNVYNKVEEALDYNQKYFYELDNINSNVRKHYFAKACYNLSYTYYLMGDYSQARHYLSIALQELIDGDMGIEPKSLVRARCYVLLGDIRIKNSKSKSAEEAYIEALKCYKEFLGLDYPEAISCKEKLLKIIK